MLPINEGGEGEPANPINRRWIEMTLSVLDRLMATGGQNLDNFKTMQAMNDERAVLGCVRMAWALAGGQEPVIKRDFAQHLVKRLQKAGYLPEESDVE
jgi:hypothetical protein